MRFFISFDSGFSERLGINVFYIMHAQPMRHTYNR